MIDRNLFKQQMGSAIVTAYRNQDEFFKKFFPNMECDDLFECYLGMERTSVAVLLSDGETLETTIPTDDFLDWAEVLIDEIK